MAFLAAVASEAPRGPSVGGTNPFQVPLEPSWTVITTDSGVRESVAREVPLEKVPEFETERQLERFAPPKGKARLRMVTNEKTKLDLPSEETASKYHHCQTDSLITCTLGPSTAATPEMKGTLLNPD